MAFKNCFYVKPIGGSNPMTIGIRQEDVEYFGIDWQYGFEKPDGSEPDWHPFVTSRVAYLDIPLNTKVYLKGNSSLGVVNANTYDQKMGTLLFYRSSQGGDAYEIGGSPQSLLWDGDGDNTGIKYMTEELYYSMTGLLSDKNNLIMDVSKLNLKPIGTFGYYTQFFMDSQGLANIPDTLVQSLGPGVGEYQQMFMNSNISKVPKGFLKAKLFPTVGSYYQMFKGCSQLNEIWFDHEYWPEAQNIEDWVDGVAPSGTFYCSSKLPRIFDSSHIPEGWVVKSSRASRPITTVYKKFYGIGGRKV